MESLPMPLKNRLSLGAIISFDDQIPESNSLASLHYVGYVLRNLRIVPHSLSASQNTARVEMAIRLKK
jgi:hypothetical protein